MARYKAERISYKNQDRLLGNFCQTLSHLQTKAGIQDFLKDLLNRQERLMLVRRLMIAELLTKGETYRDIQKKMKCESVTIARVERWLHFGRGGYARALAGGHAPMLQSMGAKKKQ